MGITDNKNTDSILNQTNLAQLERKPHYGRGIRKLRGVLDVNQKEMAAKLNMSSQQLSQLEKKEQWSEDMLQRVSDKLSVPRSGLDYLANENDLIAYIIQNNSLADTSTMMNNMNNGYISTYNIGDATKAEEIISKMENLISKLDKSAEALKKVMPK